MRSMVVVVMAALLWSVALVASSFFLRGVAIGDWVDAMLYLAAGVWLSAYISRRRMRCV